jgi:predicted double-glycine peptidase
MLIDLPTGRQSFDFDCGPKALQLVMAYYGLDFAEGELIEELKSSSEGTPVNNMVAAAEKRGFRVVARTGFTVHEVRDFVTRGTPVIVLVQAWADRYMTLADWKNDNDDGHYVIVIGFEGSDIVFEDPASFRKTWMTEREFRARWHDIDPVANERLDHFAIVLLGREPAPSHKSMEHMD